jgi:hypothetical protein
MTTSRRHLGLIIYGKTTTTERMLCKPHARAQVSSDLGRTLVFGWWGAFSFLINIFIVLGQVSALSSVGKMAGPAAPSVAA